MRKQKARAPGGDHEQAIVRLCRAYVAYDMTRGDAGKRTDLRLERAVADVAGDCIGCAAMRRLPEDADVRRPARPKGEAKALTIVRRLLSELADRKPAIRDWSFTWDPDKAAANFSKRGVTFTEGATSFLDPHGLDGVDERDPSHEKLIAYSDQQRLLLTDIEVEGAVIRIISARRATRAEREKYKRDPRDGGQVFETDGYRWRSNPYAAALEISGIRVLASALPRDARTFESFQARARPKVTKRGPGDDGP